MAAVTGDVSEQVDDLLHVIREHLTELLEREGDFAQLALVVVQRIVEVFEDAKVVHDEAVFFQVVVGLFTRAMA